MEKIGESMVRNDQLAIGNNTERKRWVRRRQDAHPVGNGKGLGETKIGKTVFNQ